LDQFRTLLFRGFKEGEKGVRSRRGPLEERIREKKKPFQAEVGKKGQPEKKKV